MQSTLVFYSCFTVIDEFRNTLSSLDTERSNKVETEQKPRRRRHINWRGKQSISIPASEMHLVNVEEEVSTPKGEMLSLYKERLCKSKERNAELRKRLLEECGKKRKLLKVLVYTYHLSHVS